MSDSDSPFAVIARHQQKLPVDLHAIARDLGIAVFAVPLGDRISGQLMRDPRRGGSSGFVIYVNSLHPRNRQRFTLAHEIAHFVLHRDLIDTGIHDDTMYRSEELQGYQEVQANRLAADILMPIMKVKELMRQGLSLQGLARQFGVSEEAMKIRTQGVSPQQGDLRL
jgi:hypothetical protein